MEMSGLASARQSLLLLISDARQSDIEHVQINRVFGTLIAPYQGILFLLACAVLWNHVPNHWLVIFLLLFAIEACVKIVLTRRYKSLTADEQKSGYWRRVLWIGMAYSGLSYGVAALVMMQPMPTDSLVVVIGVFASSVCLNTIFGRSYLPICFTTIVPIFIPTLVLLLASGNWKFQLLAIMLAGLCVLLLHVFRLSSVSSTKLMSAKEENQQLLETVTGEKLQAEKQRALAEQAVVEKNLFIAAASHDLRQPLHAFGLFLSSIREEKQSDKSRQLIHQMEKSTLSLNHLFDNLLDLSRLDAGVVVATPLDQPLSDIFEILRSEFGELAAAKNIKLIVSGDELYVHTDKVLLERMLRNLISNAIEHTDSGTVSINAAIKNQHIDIQVSDTGCGIPAEQLEHVFSEYHQIKATSNVTGKGVGLGLSIVNKICHLLDYPLQLSSTVNVGTTFSLSLPVGHQTNRALENSTSGETTLAGRKVLIVDDDEDILLGMQLVFSSWGCQTLLASNADDAVKMVFDEPIQPEYLLCDLQLAGGKSGLDVIRAINRDRPNPLPAAIVTGNTSPHRLKEIKAEGVTILHKPVVPDALKSTISSSLLGVT